MDRDDVSRPRHSRTGAKRPDEIKGEIFGPWSDGLLHRVTVTLPLRVACLDLDGTLLPKTSVSLFLADALGRTMALSDLERRFRVGEISNAVIADRSARWFAGMTRAQVWRYLEGAPWISGIAATVETLRSQGFQIILGTITWRFAAEFVQHRYLLDAVSGTEMKEIDGRLAGSVSRHFDENDKLRFVAQFCAERGFELSQCVAIGDSRSDVPLFRSAGLAIAFNATDDARAAADVAVDGNDLTIVLAVIAMHRKERGHD